MKLVIGGAYQGKLDYVLSSYNINIENVFNGAEDKLLGEVNGKKVEVIYNFHLYIRRGLEASTNVFEEIKEFIKENKNIIIISNEVGYGIVPMTKFEREYREMVGRICCYLSKEAEEVIRITCGIGRRIK